MGNGNHTSVRPIAVAAQRAAGRGSRTMSGAQAISFVTVAIAAGAGVSVVAAWAGGGDEPIAAAALGALGAIAASIVGAVGVRLRARMRLDEATALLDAASPVHPLLKRLMTEAPGTYVHSLSAANMAEAAAEAIGADALLTRVAAYYHDVGKLTQPCFFFENQQDDENPHDGEHPADSADIIMSHVVDGLAIAREFGLPRPVQEVIAEHHGTSLVRYFYHKAAASAVESGVAVYEADFRYPGPRPASREAGIVMLADASEAAARAMHHPRPDEVEDAVREVVSERIEDGQLAESALSADDIERVVAVFVRQLVGIQHARCPYPKLGSCATKGSPGADQRP